MLALYMCGGGQVQKNLSVYISQLQQYEKNMLAAKDHKTLEGYYEDLEYGAASPLYQLKPHFAQIYSRRREELDASGKQ